jgi:hypothetical protein
MLVSPLGGLQGQMKHLLHNIGNSKAADKPAINCGSKLPTEK